MLEGAAHPEGGAKRPDIICHWGQKKGHIQSECRFKENGYPKTPKMTYAANEVDDHEEPFDEDAGPKGVGMINEATGGYDYLQRIANMSTINTNIAAINIASINASTIDRALAEDREKIRFNTIASLHYNFNDFEFEEVRKIKDFESLTNNHAGL